MPMRLIETTLSEKTIRMRFADSADVPSQWLAFELQIADLSVGSTIPIDPLEKRSLAAIQRAALQRALELVRNESQRIIGLVNQTQ